MNNNEQRLAETMINARKILSESSEKLRVLKERREALENDYDLKTWAGRREFRRASKQLRDELGGGDVVKKLITLACCLLRFSVHLWGAHVLLGILTFYIIVCFYLR